MTSAKTPRVLLRHPAVVIFVVALAFRTAIALWLPERVVWPDGNRYEQVALNIIEGKGFGTIEENRLSVPTQPILMAAVYLVFGQSYLGLRLFFAVLGAASCVLGYLLTKTLFGRNAAVLAGLMLALYPHLAYLSALFEYPQTFFIFIMGLFFVFFLRFRERNRVSALGLAGFTLGIGILSVPTALIFTVLIVLLLLSRSFAESSKRILVLLVAMGIPVGAWALRNYLAYDQFVLVNAASGINFWIANNETYYRHGKKAVVPPCAAGFKDTTFCREFVALQHNLGKGDLTDVQKVVAAERASWQHGLRFIQESPVEFIVLVLKKFLMFWSPIPDAVHSRAEHGGTARIFVSILSYIPVMILAVWGAVLSLGRWRQLMPIYVYFVALTVPYCVFLPAMRYRLPLDFFLIVFAAAALARRWERKDWAPVVAV